MSKKEIKTYQGKITYVCPVRGEVTETVTIKKYPYRGSR